MDIYDIIGKVLAFIAYLFMGAVIGLLVLAAYMIVKS